MYAKTYQVYLLAVSQGFTMRTVFWNVLSVLIQLVPDLFFYWQNGPCEAIDGSWQFEPYWSKPEPRQNLDDKKYIVQLEFVPTGISEQYIWFLLVWYDLNSANHARVCYLKENLK